jgi:hypothetical protein
VEVLIVNLQLSEKTCVYFFTDDNLLELELARHFHWRILYVFEIVEGVETLYSATWSSSGFFSSLMDLLRAKMDLFSSIMASKAEKGSSSTTQQLRIRGGFEEGFVHNLWSVHLHYSRADVNPRTGSIRLIFSVDAVGASGSRHLARALSQS